MRRRELSRRSTISSRAPQSPPGGTAKAMRRVHRPPTMRPKPARQRDAKRRRSSSNSRGAWRASGRDHVRVADVEPPTTVLFAPNVRETASQDWLGGCVPNLVGAHDDDEVAFSSHQLVADRARDVPDYATSEQLDDLRLVMERLIGELTTS